MGFITARICLLHECNPTDRVLMKLNNACLDGQRVLYILTLGVLEGARQQGIGSALLRLILDEVDLPLFSPHSLTDWYAVGQTFTSYVLRTDTHVSCLPF